MLSSYYVNLMPVIERRASQRKDVKVASVPGISVRLLISQIFHSRLCNSIFYQLQNKQMSNHSETKAIWVPY